MNKSNHRSPFAIVRRLIVLVKPMLPIMVAAIVMGVAGHFCATFITIFGGFAILTAAGLQSPLPTVGTAFGCILVFALLRGVLRYAEQASNHYIAFRLLALIRDKVFGALRRLTPAKLEGRDRGDLISLITADIEALEVFYAHTISPVCIAVLWAAGMTAFTAHWHILPALALLAGFVYLLWRRVITWHVPVTILATMALFAFFVALGRGWTGSLLYEFPAFHVLAGGAILGAVFMATDYSTSPMTVRGGVIYAVGIGVITMCIRLWGAYPEGMSFAILVMNATVPLINRSVKPKRFGAKK